MQKILIIDDHATVRRGLASLVQELGWIVAIEAGSLAQARKSIMQSWTMAIMDLNLPDGDGTDWLKDLRASGDLRPVLVHSLVPDSEAALTSFRLKANGFINKAQSPEELIAAMQKVAAGGSYINADYAVEMALQATSVGAIPPHERLSPREYRVMCLLAVGKTAGQIAHEIGCSQNTISAYRARILKKLELKTTMDIFKYAISRKLVQM